MQGGAGWMQRIFVRGMTHNSFGVKRIIDIACHAEWHEEGVIERAMRHGSLDYKNTALVVTALRSRLLVRFTVGVMVPVMCMARVMCTGNRSLINRLMLVVGATTERGVSGHEGGDQECYQRLHSAIFAATAGKVNFNLLQLAGLR
jgi:hypothetical protein